MFRIFITDWRYYEFSVPKGFKISENIINWLDENNISHTVNSLVDYIDEQHWHFKLFVDFQNKEDALLFETNFC